MRKLKDNCSFSLDETVDNSVRTQYFKSLRILGFKLYTGFHVCKSDTGSLRLPYPNNNWLIYAPKVWDANNSLSTFIPNDEQKISRLLSCEFGKGSVIRDISDKSTSVFFKDLLNWKGDIAIGMEPTSMTTTRHT